MDVGYLVCYVASVEVQNDVTDEEQVDEELSGQHPIHLCNQDKHPQQTARSYSNASVSSSEIDCQYLQLLL